MRSLRLRWSRSAALLLAVATLAGLGLSAEPDPKTKKANDDLEKILPGFEKSADEIQKALEPLLASRSAVVRNAAENVLLPPENYVGGRPWTFADYLVVKPIPGAKDNPQQVLARGTFDARWLLPR